jgi:hypothetical protein
MLSPAHPTFVFIVARTTDGKTHRTSEFSDSLDELRKLRGRHIEEMMNFRPVFIGLMQPDFKPWRIIKQACRWSVLQSVLCHTHGLSLIRWLRRSRAQNTSDGLE